MKKRGKKIKQFYVAKPLGIKSNGWELSNLAGLMALERGQANETHLADLMTLAILCEQLNDKNLPHINQHAKTLKKLLEEIYNAGYTCSQLQYVAVKASHGVLNDWYRQQNNKKIMDVVLANMR